MNPSPKLGPTLHARRHALARPKEEDMQAWLQTHTDESSSACLGTSSGHVRGSNAGGLFRQDLLRSLCGLYWRAPGWLVLSATRFTPSAPPNSPSEDK